MTDEPRRFKDGDRFQLPNGQIVEVTVHLHAQEHDYEPGEKVEAWAIIGLMPVVMSPPEATVYYVRANGAIMSRLVALDKDNDMETTALDVNDLRPLIAE